MSAHRRVRPTRSSLAGRVALSGAAVLTLGAGPFVGMASAAPAAHTTSGSYPYQEDAEAALHAGGHGNLDRDGDGSTDAGGSGDILWYGLLTTAAVAGAAGAHQFAGGRRRRRA